MGRIVIIGLDGTDFDAIDPFLKQGRLPNLARLMEEGTYGRLRSTMPAMSPPAWTSFMTGKNPGKHGIFDFTVRRPNSYEVDFVSARFRRATTMWRIMTDADRRLCVLSVPITFPPEKVNGIQISGIDTPGVTGGLAEPSGMHPPELHAELMEKLGGYLISPNLKGISGKPPDFIEAAYRTIDRKMGTAHYLYAREKWDCFMVTIGETDAISHRLWQYHDKTSPLGDDASRAYEGPDPLGAIYERIDGHIGTLLKMVPADTTVFVMSDHGHAGNSDRVVFPNRWLAQQGLLQFDDSLRRRVVGGLLAFAKKMGQRNVIPLKYRKKIFRGTPLAGMVESYLRFAKLDWTRTKAYSEETPYYPTVWINVKGREPQGIVEPGAEYERVRDEIIARLHAWNDPATGRPLVKKASRREDLYSGPYVDRFPDIVIDWATDGNYSYVFKVSPSASGPSVREIQDVERPDAKTGDHRDDGIVIAHGAHVAKGRLEEAVLWDLAPTFLHLLDIAVPADMDGKVLRGAFTEDFLRTRPVRFTQGDDEVVPPPSDEGGQYSDEEKEAVRRRLQGLGYIE